MVVTSAGSTWRAGAPVSSASPPTVTRVKAAGAGVSCPISVPSMVPPSMSAVVKAPGAGVSCPISVPSMVPPSMSAVGRRARARGGLLPDLGPVDGAAADIDRAGVEERARRRLDRRLGGCVVSFNACAG